MTQNLAKYVQVSPQIVTHPKVLAVAASMKMTPIEVWPRVEKIWFWAFDNARDGNVRSLATNGVEFGIAQAVVELSTQKTKSFFKAMIQHGLLDDCGESGLFIHDWEECGTGAHLTKSEQERKSNRDRQRRFRDKQRDSNADDNATPNGLHNALGNGYVTPHSRVEKSKEELNTPPPGKKEEEGSGKTRARHAHEDKPGHSADTPTAAHVDGEKQIDLKVSGKIATPWQDILAEPDGPHPDALKAKSLYEAWQSRNNSHDKVRAMKNIKRHLRKKVPFTDLVSAFANYSDHMDAQHRPADKRKTAANFYGSDETWREYVDGIPKQPNVGGNGSGLAGRIATHFPELVVLRMRGGLAKHADRMQELFGTDAKTVGHLASHFDELGKVRPEMLEKTIAARLESVR